MDALALTYDAPAACPAEQELRAEVLARAPGERSRLTQAFRVRITAGPTFEGRLTILDEGTDRARALRATTCAELVHALALAIATSLEPEEPPPPAPSEPPRKRADAPPAPPPASEPGRAPPAPAAARSFAAGVAGGAASGLGPLLAPELSAFAELAWGARALRAGVAGGLGGPIPAGAAHGLLRRGVVRVEGCPLAWTLGALTPSLCGTAEAGLLWASGSNDANAESATRPWAAFGAAARARVAAGGSLFFEIDGRAAIPLWRDQFYFRPSTDIYTVPAVSFAVGAGAGLRVW